MYNFDFMENEHLMEIFEDVYIKQDENEKTTTIVITDKRLLFLDYNINNNGMEVLRITNKLNLIRSKEVYWVINLEDILCVVESEYYKVILKNDIEFEFNNKELYNLLKK